MLVVTKEGEELCRLQENTGTQKGTGINWKLEAGFSQVALAGLGLCSLLGQQ